MIWRPIGGCISASSDIAGGDHTSLSSGITLKSPRTTAGLSSGQMAAMRVGRMAPRMNEVISLARDNGVAIIHAPSSGMKHYEGTPFRDRMKNARAAKPPVPIQRWCYLNSEHEGPFPIVDSVRRGEANDVHSAGIDQRPDLQGYTKAIKRLRRTSETGEGPAKRR